MTKQLKELIRLIEQGTEFPEAVYQVSEKFNLSDKRVKQLENDYDEL